MCVRAHARVRSRETKRERENGVERLCERQNLRAIGSDLVVAVGKPEDIIPKYLLRGPGMTNLVLTQVRASCRLLSSHAAPSHLRAASVFSPSPFFVATFLVCTGTFFLIINTFPLMDVSLHRHGVL